MVKYAVIIPTRNGGELWRRCALAIAEQKYKPSEVIVIDSSSSDETVTVAAQKSFLLSVIDPKDFNHGGTRNRAVKMISSADILVFITQDAVLEAHLLWEKLFLFLIENLRYLLSVVVSYLILTLIL